MKSLIITEKPLVAQDFARALKVNGRNNGYIENDAWVITWCVGHLIELSYPEKYDQSLAEWDLEKLPFLPNEYKYEIKKDTYQQYKVVEQLLQRKDIGCCYWAGDSGREGQGIEEYIRNYIGIRNGLDERRVWIDSQTDEAILTGIRDAKPMSNYKNIGDASILRGIMDYAMGINFSRALSLRYGGFSAQAFGNPRKRVISVGRVMTCVLGIIVEREREIENFKETHFYKLEGVFVKDDLECSVDWKVMESSDYYGSPLLYDATGFKKRESVEELLQKMKNIGKASVKESSHKDSQKKAPLLFNLAELQAVCSKMFQLAPSQTLEVAQNLYEKKLITYPRTDARVLSSTVADQIRNNIDGILSIESYKSLFLGKNLNISGLSTSKYVDDDKITDHYAIIPTGKKNGMNDLPDMERMVYDLICRRFLAIFMDPAIYDNVKVNIMVGNESFSVTRKILKSKGYLEVYDNEKKSDENLNDLFSNLTPGVLLDIKELNIKEGKTYPPNRYSSGSLVLAMENAGQLIEDEELREKIKGCGIGTSATRGDIIDKLLRNGYIHSNEKNIVTPTKGGNVIYEIVSVTIPQLLNPKMTAEWETDLFNIEQGIENFDVLKQKLDQFVSEIIELIKGTDKNIELEAATRSFRKGVKQIVQRHPMNIHCPKCKGVIYASQYGYACENNKKDKSLSTCDFFLGNICEVMLTEEQARELIIKRKVGPIEGLKGKNGKFTAYIKLGFGENGDKKLSFEFPDREQLEAVKCPKCSGKILVNYGKGFICENNDREEEKRTCDFYIYKIASKVIPKAQVEKLLKDGKTDIMNGFKSVSNPDSQFSAYLEWDKESESVQMRFADDVRVPNVSCPICNKEIFYRPGKGYMCANSKYFSSNGSCHFFVGRICGKEISDDQLKKIVSGKKTEAIIGFKNSEGKVFSSALYWDKDQEKVGFINPDEIFISGVSCPKCNGRIKVVPGYGYSCEKNTKENRQCDFFLGKIAGKIISEKEFVELYRKGKTNEISGFKSKDKKSFKAKLQLKSDKCSVEFIFDDINGNHGNASIQETNIKCSRCTGMLYKTAYNLECGCGFKLPFKYCNHVFSDNEIEALINGSKLHLPGLISKKGKQFGATVYIDTYSGNLSSDFDER